MSSTIKRSVFHNYLYSLGLQFFKLAAPIIVIPFVYRQISPYEMGLVNLTITIMTYFYITGDLGTYIYGFREVSLNRNNKEKLNKLFSELFFFRLFFNVFIIFIYLIYILYFYKGEVPKAYFWIAGIQLLSTFFSVEWFFEGSEQFKFVSLKTVAIRFIFLLFTLFLVRGNHASEYYLLTLCAFLLVNNLISFFVLQKSIIWKFTNLNIFRHSKSMFVIFIMTNWSMFYFQFDKIFLGHFNNYVGVSYYTLAERVVLLASSVVFSFVMVVTPKLGSDLNNSFFEYKKSLNMVLSLFLTVTIPLALLIFVNASEIAFVLGGKEYVSAGKLMKLFSFMVVFYLMLEQIKTNIFLLLKKETIFFFAVTTGGVLNLSLKYIFEIHNINIIAGLTIMISCAVLIFLFVYIYFAKGILLNFGKEIYLLFLAVPVYFLDGVVIENYFFSIIIKSSIILVILMLLLYLTKRDFLILMLKKLKLKH